jgi:hypothetical protein
MQEILSDLPGYGIHINPHGQQALQECLPEKTWELSQHVMCDRKCLPLTAHSCRRSDRPTPSPHVTQHFDPVLIDRVAAKLKRRCFCKAVLSS